MFGVRPKVANRRGLVTRLWKYFTPYRLPLLGVVLLVSLTTGLGLLIPYLTGAAIDRYISVSDLHGLWSVCALMAGACLLSAGGMWAQSVAMIKIAQEAVRDIRRALFDQIQALSLRFFDKHPHGELMSRLANDTEMVSATLGEGISQLIGSSLSIAGATIIMFSMNWRLALVCIVTIPAISLTTKAVGDYTHGAFADRQKRLGELNGMIEETILGQRVVKVCGRERQTIERFSEANCGLRGASMMALIVSGSMGPIMNLFRNISFAITAAAGAWMVVRGWGTVGAVVAFMSYADYFNRPLTQLGNLYASLQSALAGADRVFSILDEAPEINDRPGAIELPETQGDVEFDHVSFGYDPEAPVLSDVSFHAMPGQTIALVGPTGAGKTTIINLLTRFYDINAGSIRIDGTDIRDLQKDSLRRALGIVLQDTFLFAGKVRESIRYGRLDASDADVEAAACLANADSFIRKLPHGYDTVLSDAGSSISQGQRQLLAIARALLADPAILILDEATSSVDTRTEIHIQEALQRLMRGRTSFIIAHRLSTIQQADCILVIDGGRIVERGTHHELLARKGAYYDLYASQFSARRTKPAQGEALLSEG